ncbi:MAG TPA: hypothetical protein DCX32_01595 [Candidatus Moranbacteria bacterium]|nr:MAG: GCN5-related N-acetyltransferase family protein [Parcubacteria group bacterium GW2011_GWC1_45_14]HAV11215.1 hypothetical protein [Candidatus Moranbacteria bacterium]
MEMRIKTTRIKKPRRETKEKLLSFYNSSFPKSQWSADYLDSFFRKKNKGVCFLAKNKKEILGFALGKIHRDDEDSMTLCALYVDPSLRGGGHGGGLIRMFLAQAFESGLFKKAIIHYRDSNDLRIFYEKSGFGKHSIVGEYSNGEKKHQMEILKENS